MVADELLSFRREFWPGHFLHAFQDELTKQECAHEWSFLAYYEPIDS